MKQVMNCFVREREAVERRGSMTPEDVIRRYSDMVYRIAFARTGTKADADDIYQEVFLRYIKKMPDFNGEEHAKAWFIKVAVNCSRKFLGAKCRRHEVSEETGTETGQSDSKQEYGNTYRSPEERFCADERKKQLYRELMKLSPDARLLIHLFYFEELKTGEIARLLHRKESTVRVQLLRAREQLRNRYEEDGMPDFLSV